MPDTCLYPSLSCNRSCDTSLGNRVMDDELVPGMPVLPGSTMGRAVLCDVMRGVEWEIGLRCNLRYEGRPWTATSREWKLPHGRGSSAGVQGMDGRLWTAADYLHMASVYICGCRIAVGRAVGMLVRPAYAAYAAALSCPALASPVLSCPVLPSPAMSCPVLPCPVLSCPALSCPALSCPCCRFGSVLSVQSVGQSAESKLVSGTLMVVGVDYYISVPCCIDRDVTLCPGCPGVCPADIECACMCIHRR